MKLFTDTLGEIENGALLKQLTEAVYKVTSAVMETRKPGGIKVKLTITPTGRGSVKIDATCDTNVPEHDRPTTTFFVGDDGSLQRNDPNQQRLPLQAVQFDAGNAPIEVKEVK